MQFSNDLGGFTRGELDVYVRDVGRRFVSAEMQRKQAAGELDPNATAEENWYADLWAFLAEHNLPRGKLPTLGGSPLDLYRLFVLIIQRGGLQSTIDSRDFKNVAKELALPPTCTAAAFALRQAYERFAYVYEQKFLFHRDPHEVPPIRQAVKTSLTYVPRPGGGSDGATPDDSASRLIFRGPEGEQATSSGIGCFAGDASVPLGLAGTSTGLGGASNAAAMASPTPTQQHMVRVSKQVLRDALLGAGGLLLPFSGASVPYRERVKQELSSADSSKRRRSAARALSRSPRRERSRWRERSPPWLPYFAEAHSYERERLVLSLQSGLREEVRWALTTLNALCSGAPAGTSVTIGGRSTSGRLEVRCALYPGLLDALNDLLKPYLEDLERKRQYGLSAIEEMRRSCGARLALLPALELEPLAMNGNVEGAAEQQLQPSLQSYRPGLFNTRDPISRERAEYARLVTNALRNLSFTTGNEIALATHGGLQTTTLRLLRHPETQPACADDLLDMWLNIAASVTLTLPSNPVAETADLSATKSHGHSLSANNGASDENQRLNHTGDGPVPGATASDAVSVRKRAAIASEANKASQSRIEALDAIIDCLDATQAVASVPRLCKAAEIIAQYATRLENEAVMITRFDTLLPRLVDMIPPGASAGRVSVQLSIAALDALASLSAFEWVARERIARTPRLVPTLVGVVAAAVALRAPELLCYRANVSPEPRREQMAAIGASLSARAALVLLNLAENPHNRQLLLPYESILVYGAMTDKVAGSTLASVLQELAAD